MACENATQPDSASSAISVSVSPCSLTVSAPTGYRRARQRARTPAQHVHQPRLVERRIGVGRAGEARHAARDRGLHLRLERRLVLLARLAQPRREIDQPGRDDPPRGIERALGRRGARRRVERGDAAPIDQDVARRIAPARGVDQACGRDAQRHAEAPATMLITAMRTAMPKVTCGRMTEWGPSATEESISTPRFIGPGCMTIASGAASASFSAVSP